MKIALKTENNIEFFIDVADLEKVSKYKWNFNKSHGYVCRGIKFDGKYETILLHRFIMGFPDEKVDHINQNKLDNQRNNLRLVNQSQNMANDNIRVNNTSGFKGVGKFRNKWRASIKVNYKFIFLGSFNNPKEAARAYNSAALKYFGEYACLNKIEE